MVCESQDWGRKSPNPSDSDFPNVRQDYMGDPGVPGSSELVNQFISSSLLGVTDSNNKGSAQETGTSSQTDVAE